jgi:glyoxylase-like metal-dependent hydrolase (beta-lactamase superfamily II)
VLDTRGHTDGSVSYLVSMPGCDGEGRILFCGDTIYGPGQLWDLYSLQQGHGTRDYHGFLGARTELLSSLEGMLGAEASAWVPSHGDLISEPEHAVRLLASRLTTGYDEYTSISGLRHYFPEQFPGWQELPLAMPFSQGVPPPPFLHHLGTTWVVTSADGAAFAVDCGSPAVVKTLGRMQAKGAFTEMEWLWVSHFHDDHVDGIPALVERFACPVVTDAHVAMVIEQPDAWRLPCISPVRVIPDRVTENGEQWTWHEFTLTGYHLPGQSYYHAGLLVEGRGQRLFFAGDSFTMAGIDDYCPGNRNPVGEARGFDACLTLLEGLCPDLILNCHVDLGFTFSHQQYRTMHDNLARRLTLYRHLLPWDDPNCGLDELWIRCHPYEQRACPGEVVSIDVVVTNWSATEQVARAQLIPPAGWRAQPGSASGTVPGGTQGRLQCALHVHVDAEPGLYVIPARIEYAGRALGSFRHALVRIDRSRRVSPDAPCT